MDHYLGLEDRVAARPTAQDPACDRGAERLMVESRVFSNLRGERRVSPDLKNQKREWLSIPIACRK